MFLKMMGILKIAQEEIDLMFDLNSALELSIETPNSMTISADIEYYTQVRFYY